MKGWFSKKKPDKDEKGFSLIELVIAIPLLAVSAGFIVSVIAQSYETANTNQAINMAGIEVQKIMDDANLAKNCYDLENAVADNVPNTIPSDKIKTVKQLSGTAKSPLDLTITTQFQNPSSTTTPKALIKCDNYGTTAKNQLINVVSTAKSTYTGRVLFKNSTTVLIRG